MPIVYAKRSKKQRVTIATCLVVRPLELLVSGSTRSLFEKLRELQSEYNSVNDNTM